jgi:hypothetical protein
VSPALGLAIAFVLIATQATRVLAPRRLGYAWAFLLAAVGLVTGEFVALGTRVGGPQLGPLHPVAEALGILAFELLGALITSPRRRAP